MIYPKALQHNSLIGVTAMAAVENRFENEFDLSLENIRKEGFRIVETADVRKNSYLYSPGDVRAAEVNSLVENENVAAIMCASGGDFCLEILPYIDLEKIKENVKWFSGSSDPTSLLFCITTKADIATLYGYNAGSFEQRMLHKSNKLFFEFLKGNIVRQESYSLYEKNRELRSLDRYNLDTKVFYENFNGDMDITGRLIGGCIDVLKDIIGTKYDGTLEFVSKYKDDGIIWYFDNFALSSETLYLTLIQFREAGWFKYAKGIIIGRVLYSSSNFSDFSYQEAIKRAISDIPVVFNADIGHVVPKMTLINGAIAHVVVRDGKGYIDQELK